MIKEGIIKIVNKEDLTYDEAYTVMNEIMSGETTPTQNAAFLAALSTKSTKAETIDEITAADFEAAAREAGLGVRMAMGRYRSMVEQFVPALRAAVETLSRQGFASAAELAEKILKTGGIASA